MKIEEAQKLAKEGKLDNRHIRVIKRQITWLNNQKTKEIEKYERRIAKWIELINDYSEKSNN